jgi:hypothetical protein
MRFSFLSSRSLLTKGKTKSSFFRGVGGILIAIVLSLPAIAQQPPAADTRDAWKPVYKQLPNLPLENKYVSRESGKVSPDNTLVSRLIEYHIYVKGRAPNYRLDWKLTLADYLGANELIQDTTYPGAKTLRQNPIEGVGTKPSQCLYSQHLHIS